MNDRPSDNMLYKAIFESAAVGIARVSAKGAFVEVNGKFSQITGYSPEELSELNFKDITHPDDVAHDLRLVEKLLAGEVATATREKRYIRKDGATVWALLTVSLVCDEASDTQFFIAFIQDISERIRAQEELKKTSRVMDLIFKHSLGSIAVTDRDFNFIRVNETYAKAGARDVSEYPGHNHFEFYPSDFEATWREVRESKQPWEALGRPFVFPDHPEWGVTYWNISLVPMLDEAGEVESFLLSLNDVTEQKTSELSLIAREKQLADSNESLRSFVHIASHDLREPLRKIATFAEMLRQQCEGDLNPACRGYLARINNSAAHMQNVVDGLRSYSQLIEDKTPSEIVELRPLAEEILSDLELAVQDSDGAVEVGELPRCRCHPFQIRQLMQNLIANGLKFKRADTPARVKVSGRLVEGESSYTEIIVEDNGIGIAEEHVESVFQPLRRLHSRNDYPGTGMGLALCQSIVKAHDGDISIESLVGKGTTITVKIPWSAE